MVSHVMCVVVVRWWDGVTCHVCYSRTVVGWCHMSCVLQSYGGGMVSHVMCVTVVRWWDGVTCHVCYSRTVVGWCHMSCVL